MVGEMVVVVKLKAKSRCSRLKNKRVCVGAAVVLGAWNFQEHLDLFCLARAP